MAATIMLYAGSVIITLWGIAHIVPTKQVVAGFEPLSADNRRVLTMEWVSEGMTLCFIGVLSLLITALLPASATAASLVYRACAAMLVVMAAWTLATGGRTSVIQFKICPAVKTSVAVLFLLGSAM
jgi:hypothetical protein